MLSVWRGPDPKQNVENGWEFSMWSYLVVLEEGFGEGPCPELCNRT